MISVQNYDRFFHAKDWDTLASSGMNSDFMFMRDFIDYKKNINDHSVIVFDRNMPIAILPLGENGGSTSWKSHPGTSYGGLVFDRRYGGQKLSKVCDAIILHLKNRGCKELILSLKPEFYSYPFASEEIYHWIKMGGQINRVRIGNVLLTGKHVVSNRRRRSLKKVLPITFAFEYEAANMQSVFEIAASNLLETHGVNPTHNFDELSKLQEMFPTKILTAAMRSTQSGEIVAGIILFENGNSSIIQYWGMKPEYRVLNVIDHLILDVIANMSMNQRDFLVFGISTSGDEDYIDQGIYDYKGSFGAGTYTAVDIRILI